MRFEAPASELSRALHLAALGIDGKTKIAALGAAHLAASGDTLTISANSGDRMITAALAVNVIEEGTAAPAGAALADLIGNMDGTVALMLEAGRLSVTCDRARYLIPCIPVADLPAPLAIATPIASVEIERKELLDAIETVIFAAALEPARIHLHGVYLHRVDGRFALCAADGHRLARAVIDTPTPDVAVIVPLKAAELLVRLVKLTKAERLALHFAENLISISASEFSYTGKLVDGRFPDYGRLVPRNPPPNVCEVDADALAAALARLHAVAPRRPAIIALEWQAAGDLRLTLADAPRMAGDAIDAETIGVARVGVRADHLLELLAHMDADRVSLGVSGAQSAILVTDPLRPAITMLQTPCALRASAALAA